MCELLRTRAGAEDPDARIGTEVGGYRIEATIGRGGMGVVYRAEQRSLGRKVALKLPTRELLQDDRLRARFERESRVAAALDHPNVIPIYEAGDADGLRYLSMRYVGGTDLRALLDQDGRLDAERALDIAAQVAGALDAAHAHGLVHRDVKPANILIAPPATLGTREHCYLTDFGLAHDAAASTHLTHSGTFVGTIDYVAPEQIDGAAPDGRADQYALACVLFECLTGHPPFPRDQEVVVMWAHLQDEPPAVTTDRPDLPAALDAVLTRALAKAPGDRFPSCSAMVEAARAAVTGREPIAQRVAPIAASTPARPTRAAVPWPSGRRFRRALARAA